MTRKASKPMIKRVEPLSSGWVAAIKREADARMQISRDCAYGSAHVVSELCREIQRQAKLIEEFEHASKN